MELQPLHEEQYWVVIVFIITTVLEMQECNSDDANEIAHSANDDQAESGKF